MKKWTPLMTCLLLACQNEAPAPANAARDALAVPGNPNLSEDPCPPTAEAPRACARLVSARRISWLGYLARWQRTLRTFAVEEAPTAEYAAWPADALNLGVTHPNRGLSPLADPGSPRSQFVSLHDELGEPLDALGPENTSPGAYKLQHGLHLTAGGLKQACRISIALADRASARLTSPLPEPTRARLERVLSYTTEGDQIGTITGFRPEFGFLTYGRRLNQDELDRVNQTLGGGSTRGDGFARFRLALAALMCSGPALVE